MSPTCSPILVTGGAGYIGAHAVLALKQRGYQPIVLDNLSRGHRSIVEDVLQVPLLVGDTRDAAFLDRVFAEYAIEAVMHFAAFIEVGESVVDPLAFYDNNVAGTVSLLQAMQRAGVSKFVFSSTCATYGLPEQIPMSEDHSQRPISPYGQTKYMVEQILRDSDAAYGLRSVSFRYFNASGADASGCLGENHSPETHLIPLVLLTALGKRPSIKIFGTDYDTPDGTCVRDYIHVSDLADAHVLGLEYLLGGGETTAFNLGNGLGFSVREVIEVARQVTGLPIAVEETTRRAGDSTSLVGSSDRARQVLGWQPRFADLRVIVEDAWRWHQRTHGGDRR